MSWQALEASLARMLADLADGATAVADVGPPREVVTRPRRLGGLLGERRETLRPYVQWLRIEEVLAAECVGGPHVGGAFPLGDAEHAALLALGWRPPAAGAYPNYAWDAAGPGAVGAAATLAVRTARDVLACPDPTDVRVVVNPS